MHDRVGVDFVHRVQTEKIHSPLANAHSGPISLRSPSGVIVLACGITTIGFVACFQRHGRIRETRLWKKNNRTKNKRLFRFSEKSGDEWT